MEVRLNLEQFKALALQYQKVKKKSRIDYNSYIQDRSWRMKKRCR